MFGGAGEIGRALLAKGWFAPVVLFVLTVGIWARSVAAPLHHWDDNVYIFQDRRVEELTPSNVSDIFTRSFFANYHPVTTLTYATDRALWGNWIPGYHLTQLAFYSGGVLILYFLFARLLASRGAALAAASIYSVHAIHVEVVAWLASRKDGVCLVFYAAALLMYVRYAERRDSGGGEPNGQERRPSWGPYAWALALSLLAMLSKGYAVVLPGAFVAYDLCFARRFRWRQVADKLPFVALAAAVTIVTLLAQGEDSALLGDFDERFNFSKWSRLVLLLKIFAVYVGRSLLPVRLSAAYAVGTKWLHWSVALAGFMLVAGAAGGFFALRRRRPAAAFGIALFVLPLVTVMNTFFTLHTWMTDRYLFFPTAGSALALVAAGAWFRSDRRIDLAFRKHAAAAGAAAVILLYAALALARVGVWTDPVLLWSDILRKGVPELAGSGRLGPDELLRKGRKGLTISGDCFETLGTLAAAYRREGSDKAAEELEAVRSMLQAPVDAGELDAARADLAAGRYDEAIDKLTREFERGEWFAPDAAKLMGDAYAGRGDAARAREWYHRSYDLYRAKGLAGSLPLKGEGALEFSLGDYPRALAIYRRLRQEAPADPHGPFNEGRALEEVGRREEAYALYEKALAMSANAPPGADVDPSDFHLQMGIVAQKLGRYQEAVRHYEERLRLKRDDPQREAIRETIETLRGMVDGEGK